MNQAENIKKLLHEYYNREGIVPDHFQCQKINKCPETVKTGKLARGMQCHIGSRYGEKMRVLVAALDCGNGGASPIDERTKNVVNDANRTTRNPHMRGTFQALAYFLNEADPKELVHYMVMINTCKCCRMCSEHLGLDYYLNCGEYTVNEIAITRPEVIMFQGKNAPVYCQSKGLLKPVDAFKEYLRIFEFNGFKCYAILCIHPSARGKSYTTRAVFYNETLPKIANYIKKNPLE